mgnify:CR=1 FL=1
MRRHADEKKPTRAMLLCQAASSDVFGEEEEWWKRADMQGAWREEAEDEAEAEAEAPSQSCLRAVCRGLASPRQESRAAGKSNTWFILHALSRGLASQACVWVGLSRERPQGAPTR